MPERFEAHIDLSILFLPQAAMAPAQNTARIRRRSTLATLGRVL
jgi:hypothetical protein